MIYELVFKVNTHRGDGGITEFSFHVEKLIADNLEADDIMTALKRVEKEYDDMRIEKFGDKQHKQYWSTSVNFISHSCRPQRL